MLEGFDRGWREVGNTREAQYTNLSPGTYTFKVRAANNDGVWTTQAKSIVIEQLPPPWKTWWAYTLYTALCGVCIAYFVFLQKLKQRKVEEQNRLLEFKVEERTRDLAEKNKDIQTLLANMRQGLLAIEEGGIIHHEYSTHLESIFETQTIAGQDVIDFLFKRALLDEDLISQMRSSINSMIGEDAMNYAMNAHILIREYQLRVADKIKTLSLDWSPILDGQDNVVRLMVSIRDSTELKALEHEAGVNKRELAIIGQLLPVSRKQFIDFARSSQRYISESLKIIEDGVAIDSSVLNKLFRNLHTLKGNSRTHGFTHIANIAHDAEAYLEQARSSQAGVSGPKLIETIGQVGAVLAEYEAVFRSLMVRNDPEFKRADGVWFSRAQLAEIKNNAQMITEILPEPGQFIVNLIEHSCAASLVDIIAATLDSLPAIANSLGKPAPRIIVNDAGILFKETIHETLNAVFTHLLRNSLDHGIEPVAVRMAAHKDLVGTISFDVAKTHDNVCIVLRDDGRGLDLNRLYQKGLELNLIDEAAINDPAKIAASIFNPGVSTKRSADGISGRGVGMDAVKQFLIAMGGDISVELIDANADKLTTLQRDGCACMFTVRLPIGFCL